MKAKHLATKKSTKPGGACSPSGRAPGQKPGAHLSHRAVYQSGRGTSSGRRQDSTPHPGPLPDRGGEGEKLLPLIPQRSGSGSGEGLLTAEDIAARLFIKPRTAALWVRQGRLPAYRIGRKLAFKWEEVERALPKLKAEISKAETLKVRAARAIDF